VSFFPHFFGPFECVPYPRLSFPVCVVLFGSFLLPVKKLRLQLPSGLIQVCVLISPLNLFLLPGSYRFWVVPLFFFPRCLMLSFQTFLPQGFQGIQHLLLARSPLFSSSRSEPPLQAGPRAFNPAPYDVGCTAFTYRPVPRTLVYQRHFPSNTGSPPQFLPSSPFPRCVGKFHSVSQFPGNAVRTSPKPQRWPLTSPPFPKSFFFSLTCPRSYSLLHGALSFLPFSLIQAVLSFL